MNTSIKQLLSAILASAFIGGCATTAIPEEEAKPAPPERVYLTSTLPSNNNATVVFIRDIGVSGGAFLWNIYINDKRAASLEPGEKVEFVLPPGEHILGIVPNSLFSEKKLKTIDQDLKAGRKYYYRALADADVLDVSIQRIIPKSK